MVALTQSALCMVFSWTVTYVGRTRSMAGWPSASARRFAPPKCISMATMFFCTHPGEKDHANTRLVQALVGTTRISADIREILTVQRPITPKCVGASGSRINDDGVSTLKQACSRRYSGLLKLSSRRFERAHNRSAPFLTLFSIAPEINGLGRYRAIIRAKFCIKTTHFRQYTARTRVRVPFLPGNPTVLTNRVRLDTKRHFLKIFFRCI